MRHSPTTIALAATAVALMGIAAAPSWACEATSSIDTSCGLADVAFANANPANAPRPGYAATAYRSDGVVGASIGDEPATVTPDDGYAPEDTRILHRRHRHRRHSRPE